MFVILGEQKLLTFESIWPEYLTIVFGLLSCYYWGTLLSIIMFVDFYCNSDFKPTLLVICESEHEFSNEELWSYWYLELVFLRTYFSLLSAIKTKLC